MSENIKYNQILKTKLSPSLWLIVISYFDFQDIVTVYVINHHFKSTIDKFVEDKFEKEWLLKSLINNFSKIKLQLIVWYLEKQLIIYHDFQKKDLLNNYIFNKEINSLDNLLITKENLFDFAKNYMSSD